MAHCPLSVCISCMGGPGRCPVAGGTVAAAVAGVPLAYLLSFVPLTLSFPILCLAIAGSCYAAHRTVQYLNRSDPKEIVLDEVVGTMVALYAVPMTVPSLLIGLAAFRIFDIWKPWPIRPLEQLEGGLGVILDDVAAGVLAQLCLRLILWALPGV